MELKLLSRRVAFRVRCSEEQGKQGGGRRHKAEEGGCPGSRKRRGARRCKVQEEGLGVAKGGAGGAALDRRGKRSEQQEAVGDKWIRNKW